MCAIQCVSLKHVSYKCVYHKQRVCQDPNLSKYSVKQYMYICVIYAFHLLNKCYSTIVLNMSHVLLHACCYDTHIFKSYMVMTRNHLWNKIRYESCLLWLTFPMTQFVNTHTLLFNTLFMTNTFIWHTSCYDKHFVITDVLMTHHLLLDIRCFDTLFVMTARCYNTLRNGSTLLSHTLLWQQVVITFLLWHHVITLSVMTASYHTICNDSTLLSQTL